MPSLTHTFLLEREARKSGGDRYKEIVPTGDPTMMGSTYINQHISRPNGARDPLPRVDITIETEDYIE